MNRNCIKIPQEVLVILEEYLVEVRNREAKAKFIQEQTKLLERLKAIHSRVSKSYTMASSLLYQEAETNGWRGGKPIIGFVSAKTWASDQLWGTRYKRIQDLIQKNKKILTRAMNIPVV
jgi:hypothetical protein